MTISLNLGNMNFQLSSHSSNAQLSSEITKNVKQRFRASKESAYQGQKVKARTDRTLSFVRSTDDWKDPMKRRKEQASMGFFSPANQPYHELGEVELNTKTLVLSKMLELGSITRSQVCSVDLLSFSNTCSNSISISISIFI